MKSIQNQYNQLLEGNLSQANFMRAIRMTFPQFITNTTSFGDSVKILKNKGILSEAKKQEHQCNPVELAMGIKVEMEHTDDPKKAEKIAMDHLKENPSYYSQLKLSGIDSHQETPKKPVAKKKAKKAKEEFVDKENAMKVVKENQEEINEYEHTYRKIDGVCYKIDDEGNRTRVNDSYCRYNEVELNMFSDEQPNAAVQQAAQFIDMNNTLKPLSGEITLQNSGDNEAILKFGYWEVLPEGIVEKLLLQFDVEVDVEEHDDKAPTTAYILTPKRPSASSFRPGVDLGASFEKFKSMLENIVREVLEEENSK